MTEFSDWNAERRRIAERNRRRAALYNRVRPKTNWPVALGGLALFVVLAVFVMVRW